MINLRPYQSEIARAVWDSYFAGTGLTFCVEIARQGGKNELSAYLEVQMLIYSAFQPKNLVKCSPTFNPQTLISMRRLKDRLNDARFDGVWVAESGYIIRLGDARAIFLSADESANVVGHTAHLLLEIDESQDVSKEKYTKEFKPMGATTNVTTVHYGTAWDDSTLLEEIKQTAVEEERRDGQRRYFRYDWQEVARYNPDYLAYVEAERQRLGENHPLFLTQYCLQPVSGGGRFLSSQQIARIQGSHSRRHSPEKGKHYVAGLDLAGEAEEGDETILRDRPARRDSTVLTIGELDSSARFGRQPGIKIVEHYSWTGRKHAELYVQLVDLLRNVWRCRRVVVDATGVGQPVASFLRREIGSAIMPFVFTQQSKSELGFALLADINSGRLKMYSADGSAEYRRFWAEMETARGHYRASRTMNFYVEPSKGHDDFLMSLALLAEAGRRYAPREARGKLV